MILRLPHYVKNLTLKHPAGWLAVYFDVSLTLLWRFRLSLCLSLSVFTFSFVCFQ
jgi:hypothetical protein